MGLISIFIKLTLPWFLRPSRAPGRENRGEATQEDSAEAPNQVVLEDKTSKLFTFGMIAWPLTFFGFVVLRWVAIWFGSDQNPGMSATAPWTAYQEGGTSAIMWLAVSCVLFASRVGCIGFTYVLSSLCCCRYCNSCQFLLKACYDLRQRSKSDPLVSWRHQRYRRVWADDRYSSCSNHYQVSQPLSSVRPVLISTHVARYSHSRSKTKF